MYYDEMTSELVLSSGARIYANGPALSYTPGDESFGHGFDGVIAFTGLTPTEILEIAEVQAAAWTALVAWYRTLATSSKAVPDIVAVPHSVWRP